MQAPDIERSEESKRKREQRLKKDCLIPKRIPKRKKKRKLMKREQKQLKDLERQENLKGNMRLTLVIKNKVEGVIQK